MERTAEESCSIRLFQSSVSRTFVAKLISFPAMNRWATINRPLARTETGTALGKGPHNSYFEAFFFSAAARFCSPFAQRSSVGCKGLKSRARKLCFFSFHNLRCFSVYIRTAGSS